MTATAVVKETPIIFTAESIRAIQDGRKTQTRRVAKIERVNRSECRPNKRGKLTNFVSVGWELGGNGKVLQSDELLSRCPYGVPGDRLWVKEAFQPLYAAGYNRSTADWKTGKGYAFSYPATSGRVEYIDYSENGDGEMSDRVTSPMFMPRWASRLALEITEVRAQRVQEISKEDAIAEGISVFPLQSADDPSAWYQSSPGVNQERTAQMSYAGAWDSINAKRGFPWAGNPWVWAISFKQVPR